MRLVDIRDTPLDVGEVVAALDDAGAGGLTLFVGQVRDHDGGESASAEGEGAAVLQVLLDEHDVRGVAAVHRVGPLAIGDLAVVVATTAAHRGDAFAASRALIDTLKAEVPIWKHQVFEDGTEEWVGTP